MNTTKVFPGRPQLLATAISAAVVLSGCSTLQRDPDPMALDITVRPIQRQVGQMDQAPHSDAYEQGRAQFRAGHYGLALAAFQQELQQHPRSVVALNGIAAVYDKLGRYDLASSYYYKALQIDPDSALVLGNLGYSFLLQGRPEAARSVLELAAAIAPGDVVIAHHLDMAVGSDTASSHSDSAVASLQVQPEPENSVSQTVVSPTPIVVVPTAAHGASTNAPEPVQAVAIAIEPTSALSVEAAVPGDQETLASAMQFTLAQNQASVQDTAGQVTSAMVEAPEVVLTPLESPAVQVPMSESVPAVAAQQPPTAEHAVTDPSSAIEPVEVSADVDSPEIRNPVVAVPPSLPATISSSSIITPDSLEPAVARADAEASGPTQAASVDLSVKSAEEQVEVAAMNASMAPTVETSLQADAIAEQQQPTVMVQVDPVVPPSVRKTDAYSGHTQLAFATSKGTVEVSNGNGYEGMASLLSRYYRGLGQPVAHVTNAAHFDHTRTVIYYRADRRAVAEALSASLPVAATLQETDEQRTDVRLVLGKDMVFYRAGLTRAAGAAGKVHAIPLPPDDGTIHIANGNGRNGMARLLAGVLGQLGEPVGRVTNADNFHYAVTEIRYAPQQLRQAQALADRLPVKARLVPMPAADNRARDGLKLVIGRDLLGYEQTMQDLLSTATWKQVDA